MPWLKDPSREKLRVEAVKAALRRSRAWEKGAFYGNVTPEGLRRRGSNAVTHGAQSLAVKYAAAYINAVLVALGK